MIERFTAAFRDMFYAAFSPRKYFSAALDSGRPLLEPALIATTATLFFATALLVITAYAFADRVIGQPELAPFVSPRAGDRAFVNTPTAARRLMFPVFWIGLLFFCTVIRILTTKIFGDRADWRSVLAVTLYAAFPLLVLSALQGVVNNVFLLTVPATESSLPWFYLRVALSTAAFVAVYLWEAWICVRGLRTLADQNAGRAFLTWFSPSFTLILLSLIFVFIKTL